MTLFKAEFQRALAEDELTLQYQPQVTPDGARIVSVEALVRWNHPTRGRVPPSEFTVAAEARGMAGDLGRWVLQRACRDGLAWPEIGISVNFSALQLKDPAMVADVDRVLAETGFPAERLEIEIVESAFIEDYAAAIASIAALRERGIRIALDDFGTGYSSLTYLRKLPLDKIKIDQSFVRDVDQIQSAAIVHAVVALARAIGLKITAEGIETERQQMFLKAAGCHFLQGFLFARPLDPPAVTEMLIRLGQRRA